MREEREREWRRDEATEASAARTIRVSETTLKTLNILMQK
jgi:hypothetical protein